MTLTFKHILAKVNLHSKTQGHRPNGLAVRVHMDRQTDRQTNKQTNKHTHGTDNITFSANMGGNINYIVTDPSPGQVVCLIKGTSIHRYCIPYW